MVACQMAKIIIQLVRTFVPLFLGPMPAIAAAVYPVRRDLGMTGWTRPKKIQASQPLLKL